MSIDAEHLRMEVIRPLLQEFDMWSEAAENLLLGTAAQESQCGKYLVQLGNGPAKGIFQMEPATADDIWENYLRFRDDLALDVLSLVNEKRFKIHPHIELVTNLAYATIMCRLRYRRVSQALPDAEDVPALGQYWKDHYNTHLGKGSVEEFIHNYERYIL